MMEMAAHLGMPRTQRTAEQAACRSLADFRDPLVAWRRKTAPRKKAAAGRYRELVELSEQTQIRFLNSQISPVRDTIIPQET
jgi:hypothetical protein